MTEALDMTAALSGFALGLSLILAIGAQNAFVLRQGILRAHVLLVVLTCALSDAVLIAAGVAGFGRLAEAAPWLRPVLTAGGALFLFVYGAMRFRAALTGTEVLSVRGPGAGSTRAAIATCLALTWLNPHVYLDTVVLIGAAAQRWPDQHLAFGSGAVAASFAWFLALGYGARVLAPVLARPGAWRMLEAAIGTLMWVLAAGLLWSL
jgi:L-lysine exporter family protein LysE/ArgO